MFSESKILCTHDLNCTLCRSKLLTTEEANGYSVDDAFKYIESKSKLHFAIS